MTPLTIEQLADHKHLPASFLAGHGIWLKDVPRGVGVSYFGKTTGSKPIIKTRTAVSAREGYRPPGGWPKGTPTMPYGTWRLHEAREAGYLTGPEGESNCWAGWYHNLPCLGLPGSGNTSCVK